MNTLWQRGGGVVPETPPESIDTLLQVACAWA
jgi:hypothetical protein